MLILAARKGSLVLCNWLLSHGCKSIVDEQNFLGHTALHEALARGYTEIVETLLAAGANATLRDAAGLQCADIASSGPQDGHPSKELFFAHLLKTE